MAHAFDTNGASKVFVLGRREEALQETAAQAQNGTIVPVRCDVTSKDSLESAYQDVAAQTSHVDVLVANSGVMGPEMRPPQPKDGSLPSLTELREQLWAAPMEDFSHVLNVNVTGAYYTVLAFLPLLEAANERRPAPQPGVLATPAAQVVITSSIAGFVRKVPFSYAYSTSKAATTHLVKMLSSSFASYDIRVNGITPGLYYSDMSSPLYAGAGIQGKGVSLGSFPREMVPAGRGGTDEDIAGLILWVASDSGGYLNGSIMVTDGGRLSAVPSVY